MVIRKRFAEEGFEGLEDKERPGRPKKFSDDQRRQIAALVTCYWTEQGKLPSINRVLELAVESGAIEQQEIGLTTIRRILAEQETLLSLPVVDPAEEAEISQLRDIDGTVLRDIRPAILDRSGREWPTTGHPHALPTGGASQRSRQGSREG